jgi:glycerol-3-phosphate dehydrogenase (NAD(P)+)
MEKKIGILGAGGWGTTIAFLLNKKGHKVTLWEPLKENFDVLSENRENKLFFPGFKISPRIYLTNSLKETLENSEMLIITVRSVFMRRTSEMLKKHYRGQPVLIGTKGLEIKTSKTMSQVLEEKTGKIPYGILSGPTIAREIAEGNPAAAVIASTSNKTARSFQLVISSEILRIYTTKDVNGVQIGGAFKNVIAIGSGIIDGLNLGSNTKASFITRGLTEMTKIGSAMGGKEKTFSGLSGIGDIITTSFSKMSRNHSFGEGIVREGKEKYLERTKMVIEGIPATRAFYTLSRKNNTESPITRAIYRIVYLDKKPEDEIKNLMQRKLKKE